jgi:hypothetical protein
LPRPHHQRRGRSYLGLLIHLATFSVVLLIVLNDYLVPALQRMSHANPADKRRIQDITLLLLTILLFYLFLGLFIALRFRRFIQTRQAAKRVQTQHIDAWAEAGRRFDDKQSPP